VDLVDAATRAAFWDFAVDIQQFWVYLATLGGQLHVTMIRTPGIYYSIKVLISAYQGKIMAFINNRQVTKEPTLVRFPTTKSWE
jgi:hypothetical protein